MAKKYCRNLKAKPKIRTGYINREPLICKITNHSCRGQKIEEINLQPSHYCPEDHIAYNPKEAKKCPAYNIPEDLANKLIEHRKS